MRSADNQEDFGQDTREISQILPSSLANHKHKWYVDVSAPANPQVTQVGRKSSSSTLVQLVILPPGDRDAPLTVFPNLCLSP